MTRETCAQPGDGKTVLVVDDDSTIVLLIENTLGREGFTVVGASNGEQCLALVALRKPDLVVLDLEMPFMGGIEALRALRNDPKTRLLPVIVVTGKPDFGSALESWMSGAENFLRKPVNMETLAREVKRLLGPPKQDQESAF